MNLNQLRFVSALAGAGSFTAAAAICFVTQPTLSNGIAQLEEELGACLFARTTRKVTLTPFGTHLLPYIVGVLSAQATLIQQTHALLTPGERLIRIGTSPLISTHLLGLMMAPFRLQNPDVGVVLREMNMWDLNRMLDEGLLDFIFGVSNVCKGPRVTTFLYEEPLLFIPRGAVWPGGPHLQSVQFKDIADETYVMVPDACGLSHATRTLFRSHRRKLHEYPGEAMSYQALEEWAALGIGAAILPKSKVALKMSPAFLIMDRSGSEVTLGFEATWPRVVDQSPHLQKFVAHLRQVVPGIVEGIKSGSSL